MEGIADNMAKVIYLVASYQTQMSPREAIGDHGRHPVLVRALAVAGSPIKLDNVSISSKLLYLPNFYTFIFICYYSICIRMSRARLDK